MTTERTESLSGRVRHEQTPEGPGAPTDPHAQPQGSPETQDEAATPDAPATDSKTARQKIAALLWWSVPSSTDEEAKARTEQLLDEYRAEVLTQVTTWLVKKAREFHAGSRKREREQGDTCAVLASKIARGAVRPDNLRMLPNPGFFEVDHTYTSGTWEFRCVAVSPSPTGGEPRALGWKFAPVYDVHGWQAIALDPDDWKHGGWTEATAAGEVTA
jgi:hypothetical protein